VRAMEAYRELIRQEIRNIVRKSLPNTTKNKETVMPGSPDSETCSHISRESSSILAQNLRALDTENAETQFSNIYVSVTEFLRRLKVQSELLLDVACAVGESQNDIHSSLDIANLLGQAVDIAQETIIKLLRIRSEQVKILPPDHFLRYFTLSRLFVNECEAISGRPGTSVKNVINDQIKDFIVSQRDREIQLLVQAADNDNWNEEHFTDKDKDCLTQILGCGKSDPPAWSERSKIWIPLSPDETDEIDDLKPAETNKTSKTKVRAATIKDETFLLPRSAILCLKGITHFLHLMCRIPSMTPDIAKSLVSYLQIYDSRCRQLVLGAGAMRSAGLKVITMKHLSVTSRALAFHATLIPYIIEFIRRHTPTSKVIRDFEKVQYSFREHQKSIYQKMVDVMAQTLSRRVQEINLDEKDAEGVSKYVVDLATDTGKLNKVIMKYLPSRDVKLVMSKVFVSYQDQLGKEYRKVNLKNESRRDQ
jgi:vacuolar protein sorting-associated protein 54